MVKFLQRNANVRKLLGKFHFISISKNQTQREIKKKKKKMLILLINSTNSPIYLKFH